MADGAALRSSSVQMQIRIEEAAKNLIHIRDEIVKDKGKAPSVLIVLCGLSNAAYQRPDGVYVVPLTALKN